MDDKTEQALTDALRLAAKSAAPYLTAMIGVGHLNEAADTIDNLRAQLAEAQREAVSLARSLFKRHYAQEPHYASGKIEWEPFNEPASVIWQIDNMVAGVREQLAEAQRDSERLDLMIEQRAYVVSDPDCCDGYWLNYARPDGTVWTQATEHETPRAAIDAARN